MRRLASLRYQEDALQIGGQVVWAAERDRVLGEETPTGGYGLPNLFASDSIQTGGAIHTVTARLDNVTNELYRNHLPLVRDLLPEIGRDFRVVYSVRF
jgi:iron complex outermembrane receptor protein